MCNPGDLWGAAPGAGGLLAARVTVSNELYIHITV